MNEDGYTAEEKLLFNQPDLAAFSRLYRRQSGEFVRVPYDEWARLRLLDDKVERYETALGMISRADRDLSTAGIIDLAKRAL